MRVVSLASKNDSVIDAALSVVPFCSGWAKPTISWLAFFGDGDVELEVAAAATGNNADHLRHPPFRSGI